MPASARRRHSGWTVNAADLLGPSVGIGTIETGKVADIIAVSRNPLEDVTRLETGGL